MDFNIEIRKKQLDNLDQLISSSKERIKSVLNYLGWSAENLEKEDGLVQCPVNPHHRIHPKSWTKHIEQCLVKIEGYDLNSQFLSEPVDNSPQSIHIDRNKKIELITKELSEKGSLRLEKITILMKSLLNLIVKNTLMPWNGLDPDPRTSDRLFSTFSPDERLIFYNYAVANTVGPAPPPEFTTLHDKKREEEKPLSYAELLAQERDAKRRRAKYKSVHINRKKHTEVIREVINGQMEDYKEWLSVQQHENHEENASNNGVQEEKKDDHERPHSSISRNSNSSSSKGSRKYRRESSKERYYKSRDNDSRTESRHRRRYSRDRDRRHSSRDRNRRR